MKTALLLLAMAMISPAAWGESLHNPSALASQDPLMRQILHRQLTQNNGGVTAAVRVATGQSIELQVTYVPADLKDALTSHTAPSGDPLSGLKPIEGLVPAAGKTAAKKKDVKAAAEQLNALQGKGKTKWLTR